MNTTTTNTLGAFKSAVANVSNHERAFRAVLGLGLVTKVLVASAMSPAAMFGLAAISVYLGMTAIMGVDPFYAAWNRQARTAATPRQAVAASQTN
jgi:hypothetical protein